MNQPEAMRSLYMDAIKFAHAQNQTVGEDNQYFITLAQLESMIRPFVEFQPVTDLKIHHYNEAYRGSCGAPIYKDGKMIAACAVGNCQTHKNGQA